MVWFSANVPFMNLELFTRNWALVIASVLGTAIFLFVLFRLYEASPRGRLNRDVRRLDSRKSEVAKAQQKMDKAEARLVGLQSRAASVKPRLVSEAEEALQDARSLKKIADDQVLRAQKLVRDVILEEFPPNRQDVMRKKYL